MSQIFRIKKADVLNFVRNYSGQRHPNYYDVLRVSPNATQKEIKQAFIELSKKMHPDITGEKSHADFAKVNEAYSILSKESTRRDYDTSLKYNRMPSRNTASGSYYYYHNPYHTQNSYTTQREWEEYMGRRRWAHHNYQPRRQVPLYWILIFTAIGVGIQVILIEYSLVFRRKALLERSREYAEEYRKVRGHANARTTEESLEYLENRLKDTKLNKRIDS